MHGYFPIPIVLAKVRIVTMGKIHIQMGFICRQTEYVSVMKSVRRSVGGPNRMDGQKKKNGRIKSQC